MKHISGSRPAAWFAAFALFLAGAERIPAQTRPHTNTTVAQTCDSNGSSRFDPACLIRIFEDTGSGQRLLLYDADHPELHSRLLKADSASTLIFDLSKALGGQADAGLNNIYITATLKKASAAAPVEVIGYSTIGDSSQTRASQTAFAFQTFANVAGKLTDLYFTTKDIIQTVYPGDNETDCYAVLQRTSRGLTGADRVACEIPVADQAARFKLLDERLALYAPEADALYGYFAKPENRGTTAQLASDVFEIDIEALQAIAQQIQDERTKITSTDTVDDQKNLARQRLLERLKATAQDLSGVITAIDNIAASYTAGDPQKEVQTACPIALQAYGTGIAKARADEFARRCYVEFVKPRYVEALKKYLVEGTLSLAANNASDGDTLTVTVQSRGSGDLSPGIQAEWRIRVQDFGWKAGIEESLLFIKRIGVSESTVNRLPPDPLAGVQPARFLPFPGFTLGATYLGRRKAAAVEKGSAIGSQPYSQLNVSQNKWGTVLAPGLGWNVTLMSFGATRDYDPTANSGKGQFLTTSQSSFEMGTGPMFSLFNNRLQATLGWNLMQPVRRQYWGLGFNFVQVGRDFAGLLKSK